MVQSARIESKEDFKHDYMTEFAHAFFLLQDCVSLFITIYACSSGDRFDVLALFNVYKHARRSAFLNFFLAVSF